MNTIVLNINNIARQYLYFELSFWQYHDTNLIIAGSEDFSYFHQLEITFYEVFAIICNSNFKIDTTKDFIFEINDEKEQYELNIKYRVIQGNKIFKLISEDNELFYIIAKDISFTNEVVKYVSTPR